MSVCMCVCECIDHIHYVSNPVCVVYMIYGECVCVCVSMCACSAHVNVWCVVYKLTRCGVNEV